MLALCVRVASGEECEQNEPRDAGVGVRTGAAAVMAIDHDFAPGFEMSRVPATIFALIHGEPAKRGLNRGFCLTRGAPRESSIDASFADTTLIDAGYGPPMRDTSGAK